jgi:uncharacterized protein (TIGR02996 family)
MEELLARMRETPDDPAPRLVYADWLTSRGDPRGELIVLDHRERIGAISPGPELERLLELAAHHGFPRVPDDPDAHILPFSGGGSFPEQYDVEHDGHRYYLRWRYSFSIDVDHVTVLECDLDLADNAWSFREVNVVLSIVSRAIHAGQPLDTLTFPDQAGFRAHPSYHVGRAPAYSFPDEFVAPRGVHLAPRDFARWMELWGWQRTGTRPVPPKPGCACGVPGLKCNSYDC